MTLIRAALSLALLTLCAAPGLARDCQEMVGKAYGSKSFLNQVEYTAFALDACKARGKDLRATLLNHRADRLFRLGRHKEATKYLERYLALVPNDPDADNIRKYIRDYK